MAHMLLFPAAKRPCECAAKLREMRLILPLAATTTRLLRMRLILTCAARSTRFAENAIDPGSGAAGLR
eukprot:1427784-Rhodomonas_salina.1